MRFYFGTFVKSNFSFLSISFNSFLNLFWKVFFLKCKDCHLFDKFLSADNKEDGIRGPGDINKCPLCHFFISHSHNTSATSLHKTPYFMDNPLYCELKPVRTFGGKCTLDSDVCILLRRALKGPFTYLGNLRVH